MPEFYQIDDALGELSRNGFSPLTLEPPKSLKIQQQFVGELTGAITGNVWCYGYAIHAGVCIYVNMGGPRTSIEAIRANFSKGIAVNCLSYNEPTIELTAGEGKTGMYDDYLVNLPEARFCSLILVHKMLTEPDYDAGMGNTYLFHLTDSDSAIKIRQIVTRLVKIPIFPDWTDFLYAAGRSAGLIHSIRVMGSSRMLRIDLDANGWTRLITGGLQRKLISLPTTL